MLHPTTSNSFDVLDDGASQFETAIGERKLTLPSHGAREVAFEVDVPRDIDSELDQYFNRIVVEQPYLTGFPPWVDSRRFSDRNSRPVERDGALRALIVDLSLGEMNDIDFWWIKPPSTFYHRRAFEDDIRRGTTPTLKQLDFLLQISRVTEAVAVALAFGRALAVDPDAATIAVAFRWSGLRDRDLVSWVDRSLRIGRGRATNDVVTTTCVVPVAAPPSWIPAYAEQILFPLFSAFGQNLVPRQLIEAISKKTLHRGFGKV